MRSFYGGASIQGAAMPGRMPAEVLTPGKSSPRGYLDYDARADTSLAKGVAILRQLPSSNGSLRYSTTDGAMLEHDSTRDACMRGR